MSQPSKSVWEPKGRMRSGTIWISKTCRLAPLSAVDLWCGSARSAREGSTYLFSLDSGPLSYDKAIRARYRISFPNYRGSRKLILCSDLLGRLRTLSIRNYASQSLRSISFQVGAARDDFAAEAESA